jgi:hypothetical protein
MLSRDLPAGNGLPAGVVTIRQALEEWWEVRMPTATYVIRLSGRPPGLAEAQAAARGLALPVLAAGEGGVTVLNLLPADASWTLRVFKLAQRLHRTVRALRRETDAERAARRP